MVKYQTGAARTSDRLDRAFAALSDPTRRAIVAQLSAGEARSVSDLARPFPVSLPAIMKHLDVLTDAGLVTRTKTGRVVACRFEAAPMEEAMEWLNRYLRFWNQQLDRLAAFVEETPCPPEQPRKPTSSQASPSNVVSMPRRKRSTRRGPTRRT
jgi:DNA-binding transcriptional ArsR family regulator